MAKRRVEQTRSRGGEIHLRHRIEGRFHLRHILRMINRVFRRGIQLDAAPESWYTWTVRRLRLSSTGEPAWLVSGREGRTAEEKCDGGGRQEGARYLVLEGMGGAEGAAPRTRLLTLVNHILELDEARSLCYM